VLICSIVDVRLVRPALLLDVVAPFAIGDHTENQVATACINLALGICVLSLLGGVMARTVRVQR
jgi:hypothetical protein